MWNFGVKFYKPNVRQCVAKVKLNYIHTDPILSNTDSMWSITMMKDFKSPEPPISNIWLKILFYILLDLIFRFDIHSYTCITNLFQIPGAILNARITPFLASWHQFSTPIRVPDMSLGNKVELAHSPTFTVQMCQICYTTWRWDNDWFTII